MKLKIEYFNNAAQEVTIKTFTGANAFTRAVKWGMENLENFSLDHISRIK